MKSTKRDILLAVFAYGTLALCAVLIAVAACWLLYPYQTYKVHSVKLLDKTVQQGGTLSVLLDYTRYTDKNSTVSRQFMDGILFTVPSFEGLGTPGHYVRFVPIAVPDTLPPGTYIIRTTSVFRMNPLRTITVSWETEQFTVTGHADAAQDTNLQ